jgi:glycosyltransferase involved in cell wall biosynthesis
MTTDSNSRPKLYYMSASRIPSEKASSVHVLKMCQAFEMLGLDTHLFCQKGRSFSADTLSSYDIRTPPVIHAINSCFSNTINSLVILVLYFIRAAQLPIPAVWYCRHLYCAIALAIFRKPVVVESHAIHRNPLTRRLIALALNRPSVRGLVVISEQLKEDYQEHLPRAVHHKIFVAHDGASQSSKHRESYALRRRRPTIGYAGSLYAGKGLEIIAAVATQMEHVDFVIAGGSQKEIETWKLNCPPNIIFIGQQPHAEIEKLILDFDICLLPNQPRVSLEGNRGDIGRWTSPLKLFEYMALGSPIVASDLPVLREVLTADVDAILVNPLRPSAWVEAINKLLQDESLRARMGKAARRKLEDSFSWEVRAKEILKFIRVLE